MALAIYNWQYPLIVIGLTSPLLGWLVFLKIRVLLFQPYRSISSDGVSAQHWRFRHRHLFRRKPVLGLVTKANRIDPNLPHELQEAILADINNDLTGSDMPVTEIKRYRRRSIK